MKTFIFILISLLLAMDIHGEAGMVENETSGNVQTVILGGGCFWCLEPVFEGLKGVNDVKVGYAGGVVANPSYQAVCSGTTGHAEVVQVIFQPSIISFDEIMDVFFTIHDPTTINRQGADVGTQYRSIILYHDQQQKESALEKIKLLNMSGVFLNPVVTEVSPFDVFYEAEAYHQDYFENNPNKPYCQMVIRPKVEKARKVYSEKQK